MISWYDQKKILKRKEIKLSNSLWKNKKFMMNKNYIVKIYLKFKNN